MSADDSWSAAGYVVEVPYTREFFRFQTPLAMSFAALCNDLGAPDPTGAFDYLDLGCGEAITLLILAACHPNARFVGVDMNPAHIESASRVAKAAGLKNLELKIASFDEFAETTTQRFDFIAAHGIYTWVNEDGRRGVRNVVAKGLRPGGLFYLSHYVRPGADRTKALYDMVQVCLEDHADLPIIARIRAVIADLRALQAAGAPIFGVFPDMDEDLTDLETRDGRYLAHEFGNKNFEPLTFTEVANSLMAQGLVFAGSARADRNRPENRIGTASLGHLAQLDRTALEARMSYLSDESFRWDIFTRQDAPRPASPALRSAGGHLGFGPVGVPRKVPRKARHGHREIIFDTPETRAFLEVALTGTSTIAALLDAAPDGADAGVSRMRDVAATRILEPQLCPNRNGIGHSQKVYRHGHALSAILFDRDFATECVGMFPAPVLGTALQLYGVQAVATRMLHNRKPGEALETARAWVNALTPSEATHLSLPAPDDRKAFDREAVIFLRQTFPRLLRWGVIEPDEAG